jgi:hypothetical protein
MRQTLRIPRDYRPGSAVGQNRQLIVNEHSKEKINLLINSVYYFLHRVFIVSGVGKYRLVVIKDNQMLMDKTFPTLRGAKISFARIYGPYACQHDISPSWSITYSPYAEWLNTELSCPLKKRYH